MKKLLLILSFAILLAGCGATVEQKSRFCLGASAASRENERFDVLLMPSENSAVEAGNCFIITDTQIEWAFDK